MDGGALRLTASGGPSSGHCRPAPRSQHPQRALDADRCAGRRHPVLFSAAKSISFSPSAPSRLLLGRAAATFPRPAARSRPFDPACCAAESSDRAHSRLGRPLLPVHRTRARGGRPGRHHLRVLQQHPGRRPTPALRPLLRAAGHSTRPLRGETVCLLPCMTRYVVAAVCRVRGGGGENEPGLRARD